MVETCTLPGGVEEKGKRVRRFPPQGATSPSLQLQDAAVTGVTLSFVRDGSSAATPEIDAVPAPTDTCRVENDADAVLPPATFFTVFAP